MATSVKDVELDKSARGVSSECTPELMYDTDKTQVFVSIFKGGKNARRDIRWEDFERVSKRYVGAMFTVNTTQAMKHAGFEVKPMDGSARRFTPPPLWNASCITFHKASGSLCKGAMSADDTHCRLNSRRA